MNLTAQNKASAERALLLRDRFLCAPFVILGLTRQGKTFRPSDWAERLTGTLASFCPRQKKLCYSKFAMAGHYEKHKAVFVEAGLAQEDPESYAFLIGFACDNDLEVVKAVCDYAPPR